LWRRRIWRPELKSRDHNSIFPSATFVRRDRIVLRLWDGGGRPQVIGTQRLRLRNNGDFDGRSPAAQTALAPKQAEDADEAPRDIA
jgi:hypothetical protein